MEVLYFIGPLIGGIIFYALISVGVRAPGQRLAKKFVSLGDMKGKTFEEIKQVVGLPQSVSYMGDGTILRQWMATGYHICILFDKNDNFLGIESETAV